MRRSQLRTRVRAPVGAAQPLAVEQLCAGEEHAHGCLAEGVDRFAIRLFRDAAMPDAGAVAAALAESV